MYCIYNRARDLFCRWDENIILFETKEQITEFMNVIPAFFAGEHNYIQILETEPEEDACVVLYTDLSPEKLRQENENLLRMQMENTCHKEVLKDG